jgi:hypothetical protein
MTIFELAFLGVLIAIAIFLSRLLGHICGVSWLFILVPLGVIEFLIVRWLGDVAMGRRKSKKWPFDENNSNGD